MNTRKVATLAPSANDPGHKSPRYGLYLGLIVLLALIVRLSFLANGGIVIDSDEAIVGLMAKHILEGGPIPTFYYGQHYMGSLEPLLTTVSFSLLGYSAFALKLVPLVFSLILICLVYELAKRFVSPGAALLAALLAAIPPSPLLIWSVMARGGFIELLVIGSGALIISVDLIREQCRGSWRFIWIGLLLGLGWWVNNQIIFYMAPIGLVVGLSALLFLSTPQALQKGVLTLSAFIIGGLPFWIYNLLERPRLRSFGLFAPAETSKIPEYFQGFLREALPMMLGAKRFWSDADIFPFASIAVFAIGGLILVNLIVLLVRGRTTAASSSFQSWWLRRSDYALLLAFSLFLPSIFCLSSFGWLSQAPRYLLPLYSILFVVVVLFPNGFLPARMSHASITNAVARMALVLSVLTLNLISNYSFGGSVPGQPFVFMGERVPTDNTQLYSWLNREGHRFIRANYWIGYRVAFETKERIRFSHFRGQGVTRIPEYERAFPVNDEEIAYVLTPKEATGVARAFSLLGYTFRTTSVGGYKIIDQVDRSLGNAVKISVAKTEGTLREDWIGSLTDGETGSRWGSGRPQDPSMRLSFDFPPGKLVSAIDIDYAFWKTDYPRELLIEAERPDGTKCVLMDTRGEAGLKYYLEGEQVIRLRLAPQEFRSVSMQQLGSDPVFDWSVAEVTFWGPIERTEFAEVSKAGVNK